MNQTASNLLMVRPVHFGYNEQTASTNLFQEKTTSTGIAGVAAMEFDKAVERLREASISVITLSDRKDLITPDAVFPNNWISFHENGTIVVYPMMAPNRRLEKRFDIPDILAEKHGFFYKEIIDLSIFEKQNQFLEGTGSLIFDHLNKKVFMAISNRSSPKVLNELSNMLGYKPIIFNTQLLNGVPVYHTNVIMCIGNNFAIVCSELIEPSDRKMVLHELELSGKQLIEITKDQTFSFAGNMLEVRNEKKDPFILLSETALNSLKITERKALESFASLLPVSIPNIEKTGGGGIRCMCAEIFLPEMAPPESFQVSQPQTTAEFEQYFALRWKVLRKPWGQPVGSEKDELEETSIHFMATAANRSLAGVGRLQFLDDQTAQVRFMAVDEKFRGAGVGKLLMLEMEFIARKHGRTKLFLQARENAVPFYQSLGYLILEKTFLLYGEIQHFSMEKVIS
ncbi:MAG: GNAT family N-acetyltransferase [Bacteroidetes bacterium]|nr:GNAT family N-acetyltransferase [Bacteroidota bacterium]